MVDILNKQKEVEMAAKVHESCKTSETPKEHDYSQNPLDADDSDTLSGLAQEIEITTQGARKEKSILQERSTVQVIKATKKDTQPTLQVFFPQSTTSQQRKHLQIDKTAQVIDITEAEEQVTAITVAEEEVVTITVGDTNTT